MEMTMNTTVNIFSENSSHTTSRSASNNSYQVCEMTADSAPEITAKAVAYFFIFLVSFFGNIFILVVIYKNKRLPKIHQLLCFQHGCIRSLQPFDRHDCEDR